MKKTGPRVRVAGAGLAGVEAAFCLASRGIPVDLYEMRPAQGTPAHKTSLLGELVCSNSFKGTDPGTAHGLLKREMELLGSLVMRVARETKVPAGKALAVDREAFAREITRTVESLEGITLIREEVGSIDPDIPTIIATGPLTSDRLAEEIARMTGSERLFFYDAIAPIVDGSSIDHGRAFFGSRWSKDENDEDYLNCPLTREEYETFVRELLAADRVNARDFEDARFFEACLPVEVMAGRGAESLRYGPMRPVGMVDPASGDRPYAVVQLRRENLKGDAYNLVGFQTRLTYPEQRRIFSLIPALASAQYLRYGSIHRNTFIDSPLVLREDLSLRGHPNTYLAGQITGVEGYMESASMGIAAGLSLHAHLCGREFTPPPACTAIGALIHYITQSATDMFQPTNINFGIMEEPDAPKKYRKQRRLELEAQFFEMWMKSWMSQSDLV
jgi:methylenetetrahydrofolate--tRNA-(uracil-5-)-methyltransferase